ncbi:MAG: flavodoxin family protein [Lachnospiraceae bacterium]|nr:flavodoxin family protein [Lachnospiraceae bacterium]
MKVLLVNGSPHEKGCTYTGLLEVAKELEKNGVETEIIHIGTKPIGGCIGCGGCVGKGRCVFGADGVNSVIEKAETADGFVFGSPVHYAAAAGNMTSLMDRVFYAGKKYFSYKPGAVIVSCRRGGATATFDQLNKYMTISNMLVVGSQYWNMIHGSRAEDVAQDQEGLQTMRTLGRNMVWVLKCLEAGKAAGISIPEAEAALRTNFIR